MLDCVKGFKISNPWDFCLLYDKCAGLVNTHCFAKRSDLVFEPALAAFDTLLSKVSSSRLPKDEGAVPAWLEAAPGSSACSSIPNPSGVCKRVWDLLKSSMDYSSPGQSPHSVAKTSLPRSKEAVLFLKAWI